MQDHLEAGREAIARADWPRAFAELAAADDGALDAEDLDGLGLAARLVGQNEAGNVARERAHAAWLVQGEPARAARSAFWLGMALMLEGEEARGGAWLGRAATVLDEHDLDTAERGLLLLPPSLRALRSGAYELALEGAGAAYARGRADGDPDVVALSLLGRGQSTIALGRIAEGIALLDEAMLVISSGAATPVPTGIVFCTAIESYMAVCDIARAEQWTRVLTSWCDAQPGMVSFRGQCLVHRAELQQLRGNWSDADAIADDARQRFAAAHEPAEGDAWYVVGELARLRGRHDDAEAAFREAARLGRDPCPGLALLRLATGDTDKALATSRRVVADRDGGLGAVYLLAAHAEICSEANEPAEAQDAVDRLLALAADHDVPMPRALGLLAAGRIRLATGDATGAERQLRDALTLWLEMGVPLQAARTRVLLGQACAELGDLDTAELEWDNAREVFERLGAQPCLAELDRLTAALESTGPVEVAGGLTGREVEVLGHLAEGKTNREIAEALVISEKTVSRHLSNIFTKLGVSSRSAATAWAYQHGLV